MSQFQSKVKGSEEIFESEFRVLSRSNTQKVRANEHHEKEDQMHTSHERAKDLQGAKNVILEASSPIDSINKEKLPAKTDHVLLNSEFVGSINAFSILLQFEDQLVKMNAFNLLVQYLEYLAGSLINSASQEIEFSFCTIASASYQPEAIKEHFNSTAHNETTFNRSCVLLHASPLKLSQYLDFDSLKREVTFPMLEILRPFLNKRAIHYLFFLFASNQSQNELEFFISTVAKLHVFLMVESLKKPVDSEDRWFKREIDHFYKMLFLRLKRKEFVYAILPVDDVQIILNIKDVYKLFERC